MAIARLRTLFSFVLLLSTIALFSCSKSEQAKPEDPRIARIAAVKQEIALGKAVRTTNASTWVVRTYGGVPYVGIWSDNAGTTTTEPSYIRVDLDNTAGDGLEVQMVYNGSDNGQLIFQDWTNVGTPTRTHYYEPSDGNIGGWRDIYFAIPGQYLSATSDVYVTLRWRSFTGTTTSDWTYFTRHWYHGNKGY